MSALLFIVVIPGKNELMIMHIRAMLMHWQSTVLFLCAVILFTGCVTTQEAGLRTVEEYPCNELEQTERNYNAMKRQSSKDEERLLDMRQRISMLQQDCNTFKKNVNRYTEQFGYSIEEAEKKAAMSVRSARTHDVRSSNGNMSAIYAELAGQSVAISVNYEHIFPLKFKPIFFAVRAGLGWAGGTSVPVTASFMWGNQYMLEVGLGILYTPAADNIMTACIGYRYQPRGQGLLFRIGFTPLLTRYLYLPVGLSIGYVW